MVSKSMIAISRAGSLVYDSDIVANKEKFQIETMIGSDLDGPSASLCRAAAAHGGNADINPMQDLGFMYNRHLADPDGHVWEAMWMDPAAMSAAAG